MKRLMKTAFAIAAAGGVLSVGAALAASLTPMEMDGGILNRAVTPSAVDPSAPLYSNLVTDSGQSLLNGGVSASGTTRYSSMVCNRMTLSQPGPQQITAFNVVLRNGNAATFTPTATSIYFYDDSGVSGAPGVRLLHRAGLYYGGGNYAGPALPANGTYQLNAAPFGYTAAYVPTPTASTHARVWACVAFSAPQASVAQLANLGLENRAVKFLHFHAESVLRAHVLVVYHI